VTYSLVKDRMGRHHIDLNSDSQLANGNIDKPEDDGDRKSGEDYCSVIIQDTRSIVSVLPK
jgi:hypothetical protein